VTKLLENSIPLICVDVANGYTKYFVDRIKLLRSRYPYATIMAGNVATPEMVQELILEGADIVKVGIGPGSHCTTRMITGLGYPQLTANIECADAAHGLDGFICADGGCSTPGDIAKAFGAGADFVMLGGMLAGTSECEGVLHVDGLEVHGMASKEAQDTHYGGVPDYAAPEGKTTVIPYKGPVAGVMQNISGALRSTCAYVGASGLRTLSKCTTFIRVGRMQ
jgi:GMP reductase